MHVFLFKLVRLLFQLTQCIISKKNALLLTKAIFMVIILIKDIYH